MIKSGKLGNFISCRGSVTWHREAPYYELSDWHGVKAKEGGGVFLSQAIHTVDLVRWLCGPVVKYKGYTENIDSPYTECEDTGLLTMIHENGGISNILATNNHGIDSPIELEMIFEEGILRFDKNELLFAKEDQYQVIASDNIKTSAKIYWGNSHLEYIDRFYGALRDNKKIDIPLIESYQTDMIIWSLYGLK